jgi:hypothetical protein
LKVIQADFLDWSEQAASRGQTYTKIVMNPPFADGRAKLHVEHAYSLLAPGGRLVSVVPASMRGMQFIEGVNIEWSRTYVNEFNGTDVAVVFMTVTRPAPQIASTTSQPAGNAATVSENQEEFAFA